MKSLLSRGFGALLADLRYGWRGLRRRRTFTLIAALILALGIGATTAVFSLFYAVLMRPLPYKAPQRLVIVWAGFRSAGNSRAPVSGAILREIRQRSRSLSGVAGIWVITRTFAGQNPEQVKAARVTANFFDVLGVPTAIGHSFTTDENGGPAIILANGIFKSRFAGNRRLLGKALPIEGADNLLIGVLSANFQLHFARDANVPANVQVFETFWPGVLNGRKQYFIRVIGRMKHRVSIAEAQHDLDRVGKEIRAIYPEYARDDLRFTVVGMQADAVRQVRPALTALFAGAAFVLFICCLNLSGLLVARASDRRKEMAIRLALGASRLRIVRQLLVESCILCLLGGGAGILLAWAGSRGLIAIRPEQLAPAAMPGLSWPVLLFAVLSTFGAAILFGLMPAIESFRTGITATLQVGTRSRVSHLHRRSGNALIILEVAVTFMLLAGAGLTFKTLSNMEQVRPGFQPRYLLAFQIGGPLHSVDEWQSALAGVPGVKRVGATSHLPFDASIPNWYNQYYPEESKDKAPLIADLRCITPGYFAAMGAHLLEGRYFNKQDSAHSQEVAIVDEIVARSTWPGQRAIGKKITVEHASPNGFRAIPSVVVGVVQHLYSHSLVRKGRGQIYMPYDQSPRSPLTYVLRTRSLLSPSFQPSGGCSSVVIKTQRWRKSNL